MLDGVKVVKLPDEEVVGLARRVERIQINASTLSSLNYPGKLHPFKCDIRKEEDLCNAFTWTTNNIGVVHILVNNAGVCLPTNLINGDSEMWKAILETNIFGLCVAQREACKLMTTHNISGHIVNINSIAGHGHYYFPSTSIYGATKHALTNICEMLRSELTANKSKIKVTSVSPGLVDTQLVTEEFSLPGEMELMEGVPLMECKDIADAVVYALSTSPSVMINEITLRAVGSPV
ncbi:farnesol dehydrogenase-like isoform X2 [Atheta coriaria]|uniref:farnesol dehydrogenase-like isoform X2 n=1 Tax=Dalotia coriaria TaxID=877792 RepID=UPI0031F40D7D